MRCALVLPGTPGDHVCVCPRTWDPPSLPTQLLYFASSNATDLPHCCASSLLCSSTLLSICLLYLCSQGPDTISAFLFPMVFVLRSCSSYWQVLWPVILEEGVKKERKNKGGSERKTRKGQEEETVSSYHKNRIEVQRLGDTLFSQPRQSKSTLSD